jgi:uncharacterized protein (TIGR02452 family)
LRDANIKLLKDTLEILEMGRYIINGETISLKLSKKDMETVQVLLPDDVREISRSGDDKKAIVIGRCLYDCKNMDAFTLARERGSGSKKDARPTLVLNLADWMNPGGGARRGDQGQEEDLCRKSSILLSLESDQASKYYVYNRSQGTGMGTDAMMFTPKVEIIRDENGKLLDKTTVVAVLTCGAPMARQGQEGMSEESYRETVYSRITAMLKCAAYFGYKNLVLGAWGCGALGNDARIISDLFYKALKEIEFMGKRENGLFNRIDFAVLDRTAEQYNFKEFYRNFGPDRFYRDENQKDIDRALKRIKESEKYLDKIRGCLFGGAVGDALGYPIEFLGEEEIFTKYGRGGIENYQLDPVSGKALISDDTQMSLFTANGILVADTRVSMRGIGGIPHDYLPLSYRDWLYTQKMSFEESRKYKHRFSSWISHIPGLYSRRAPGITCLSALEKKEAGSIENPINDSKGCGGIMRVAPLGLMNYNIGLKDLDREGARIAALTHGHSLGYMPAAVLVHIIHRIVFGEASLSLKGIVIEARDTVREEFTGDSHLKELTDMIDLAVDLSENGDSDLDNIHRIGQGWVAEETLGIGIYCSLKYKDDFSAGIIAAVNHQGDSDSTGAVTGNILGAVCGYRRMDEKWKTHLELADVLLEMADDLCHGCQMDGDSDYKDPDWIRKYMYN